jgi:hypothetical protein
MLTLSRKVDEGQPLAGGGGGNGGGGGSSGGGGGNYSTPIQGGRGGSSRDGSNGMDTTHSSDSDSPGVTTAQVCL